ncbi:MAG: adenylyltransferase/cytidyltransferase family protein [Nitrosarchaeum sp.]|nr:adenylyltransferase/cytidyltransferase family protein [Nitrosarchaeum sp.]
MLEKLIIAAIYQNQITKEPVVDLIRNKSGLTESVINAKIDEMTAAHLISKDGSALTELGRSTIKVVLAGGVFDIIHPGHIYTLNAARMLGDVLVVVVATDNTAIKMKKRKPLHSQEQRKELVNSLKMVDFCLVGQEDDIFKTVNHVRPEVIALGYDQVHQEKFIKDGCRRIQLDAEIARLQSPIPDSSSSKIQKEYGDSIHGI